MELKNLINNIIPHYNNYRKNQNLLTGTEALEIIWETGDLIKKYLENKNTAPRTLYHQIYGKSEGNTDIAQKSYITRDFLDRAYRVRRIFKKKEDIRKLFPNLQRYRLFYKSMPFFDDGRYKMNQLDQQNLIQLLNSSKTYKEIITQVEKLKKERIGLSIPHNSKLKELEEEKEIFINTYNYIYKVISDKDYEEATKDIAGKNILFLNELSKNTGALSSDQLMISSFDIPTGITGILKEFSEMINKLASKKDAKERRRFRRLIPPEKMIRLSEMIYALRSEEDFKNFRL